MEKENLTWEEVSTEHIVQDEWIDFRKSAYRSPDGRIFQPYYSFILCRIASVISLQDSSVSPGPAISRVRHPSLSA